VEIKLPVASLYSKAGFPVERSENSERIPTWPTNIRSKGRKEKAPNNAGAFLDPGSDPHLAHNTQIIIVKYSNFR
jgi:hypothetical protein